MSRECLSQERAKDQFAEVSFLGHDDLDLFGGDPKNSTVAGDDSAQIHGLSGEEPHFADELTRSVGDDREFVGLSVVLDDSDRAFQDDDHVVGLVAVGEQDLSLPHNRLAAVAS